MQVNHAKNEIEIHSCEEVPIWQPRWLASKQASTRHNDNVILDGFSIAITLVAHSTVHLKACLLYNNSCKAGNLPNESYKMVSEQKDFEAVSSSSQLLTSNGSMIHMTSQPLSNTIARLVTLDVD